MDSVLKQLSSSISPSGFEGDVLSLFKEMVSPFVDTIRTDEMGNLIAQKNCNKQNARTILLVAHADEVGFVIKRIDERGFVYVTNIGGIHIDNLSGKIVVFSNENGYTYGTFGEKPIHMTTHEDKANKDRMHISDLWVDIGCNSYSEAIKRVSIGDYATFAPFFQLIGNDFVMAKALDNRVSMYVIYEVLKQIEIAQNNVVVAITVQEEIGRRGAMAIANAMNIKNCIVLDVTHATDYPTINVNRYGDIKLGEGVVVPFGANINNEIQKRLISISNAHNISYQREVIPLDSRTDAAVLQNTGYNRYIGIISVPIRYMHSSTELANKTDVNAAIKLVRNYIETA